MWSESLRIDDSKFIITLHLGIQQEINGHVTCPCRDSAADIFLQSVVYIDELETKSTLQVVNLPEVGNLTFRLPPDIYPPRYTG